MCQHTFTLTAWHRYSISVMQRLAPIQAGQSDPNLRPKHICPCPGTESAFRTPVFSHGRRDNPSLFLQSPTKLTTGYRLASSTR